MNITHISLRNFRSWEDLELHIDPGCTLLSGPNGAGKSSILEAALFAMYGATSDAGRLVRRGTDEAVVRMSVDTDHGPLIVERVVRVAGGRAAVHLAVWGGAEMASQNAATVTETQQRLEVSLGISREVLLASAFSTQHGGAAFTEAAPRDRKRIFSAILELGLWEALHEAAKSEAKQAKDDAILARARVEQLDGAAERSTHAGRVVHAARAHLGTAQISEQQAEAEAQRLAAEAEAAREARRQHAAAVEAAERARADHERATAERAKADEALQRAKAAATNAPKVGDAQASLEMALIGVHAGETLLDAAMTARSRWVEQIAPARAELRDLQGESETGDCARCGQPLAVDLSARLASASAAVSALEAAEEPEPDDTLLRAARATAQAAQTRLAEAETIELLAGNINAFQEAARDAMDREMDTAEQLRLAVIMSKPAPVIDEDAEAKHMAALDVATHARLAHLQAASALATADAAAQHAEREANAETEARTQHATAQHVAAILEILATGFGPNGVPALVIDNILGQLADEANRVLTELGTPIRVDLRSQRVTQAGKIVDALDIIVLDGVDEAPYETLSGGERTRVALALRAALTRLLAAKSGAQVRMLIIDEPQGLDAAGAEAFADVLQAFIHARIFDTALIVTHDERLADRIDRVIRITKTPGGTSRLTENSTEPPTAPFPSGGSAEQLQEVDHA